MSALQRRAERSQPPSQHSTTETVQKVPEHLKDEEGGHAGTEELSLEVLRLKNKPSWQRCSSGRRVPSHSALALLPEAPLAEVPDRTLSAQRYDPDNSREKLQVGNDTTHSPCPQTAWGQANDTGHCSPTLLRKAIICVDAGFGVRAWQCQRINTEGFHRIPFLKEIHLSYFLQYY